jgi:hypothetical protein
VFKPAPIRDRIQNLTIFDVINDVNGSAMESLSSGFFLKGVVSWTVVIVRSFLATIDQNRPACPVMMPDYKFRSLHVYDPLRLLADYSYCIHRAKSYL